MIKENIKNKKSIFLILLLFFLLASFAYAQENPISGTLRGVNDFFENKEYEAYTKLIDFMLFFLVALSALLIGVKAVFPEKRQATVIAVIIALIFTFSLIKRGVSITSFLPYVGYFVFFGLVVIIYFILMATNVLKERKRWAIVVSLVIAFIIFVLLGWVFDVDAQGLWSMFTETVKSMGLLEPVG